MKIQVVSRQGSAEWNEDAFVVRESAGIYGVFDGATSLNGYRDENGETGGSIASRLMKRFWEDLTEEEASRIQMTEALLAANDGLRTAMLERGIDTRDPSSQWMTGAAIVRIGHRRIEYAQVGDCTLAAVYEDGSVRVLSRDSVAFLDRLALNSPAELRSGIIARNRLLANTPDGYPCLNGDPRVADYLEYGSIHRIRVQGLLLLTDGLFDLTAHRSDQPDLSRIVSFVLDQSLDDYVDWLVRVEHDDHDCVNYPRFKLSDDKTGIWIALSSGQERSE